MTTKVETVADILRPLAEREDRHFDALRVPLSTGQLAMNAMRSQQIADGVWPSRTVSEESGLDTSLGAIVRAAVACGYSIALEESQREPGVYNASLASRQGATRLVRLSDIGKGLTPEEAAARALVAAVAAQEKA